MKCFNISWMLPIVIVAVTSGCSDNPDESTTGKWLEAPKVLTIYLANTDLIISGRDKDGCPAVIEMIRKQLREGRSTYEAQAVIKVCSSAGLEFGEKVTCNGIMLQVKCM